ncbi:MAG: T9SS type A sorting domain-containing protein [Bacteroidetes bacterium]|nr:T9SS type A sorting domain-containing protein [Bacteroidota bacterium]
MKYSFPFLILMLIFQPSMLYAQDWEWVLEGEGFHYLTTTSDEDGNIYAVGLGGEKATMGHESFISEKKFNLIIFSLTSHGNFTKWLCLKGDSITISEIVAQNGKVFFAGYFSGALSGEITTVSKGKSDILWGYFDFKAEQAKIFTDGSMENEFLTSIDVKGNSVLVGGNYSPGASISGTPLKGTSNSSFVIKYSIAGNYEDILDIPALKDNSQIISLRKVRAENENKVYLFCFLDGVFAFNGTNFSFSDYTNNNFLIYSFNEQILKHTEYIDPHHPLVDFKINHQQHFFRLSDFGSQHRQPTFSFREDEKYNSENILFREYGGGGSYDMIATSNGNCFHFSGNACVVSGTFSGNVLPEISGEGLFVEYISDTHNYTITTNNSRGLGATGLALNNNGEAFISGIINDQGSFGDFTVNGLGTSKRFLAKINPNIKPSPPSLKTDNLFYTAIAEIENIKISSITKNVKKIEWVFPEAYNRFGGSTPVFRYVAHPEIKYKQCGVFSAKAIISNGAGILDTINFEDFIKVVPQEISIIEQDSQLCCSLHPYFIEEYFWHLNDSLLTQEKTSCISLYKNGNYKLEVKMMALNCQSTAEADIIAATIEHQRQPSNLYLFPNPASTHFTLSLEEGPAELTIIDFTGRVVLKQSIGRNQKIDTSSLYPGIYTVQVQSGEKTSRKKLIIY